MVKDQEMVVRRCERPRWLAEWTVNGKRYYPINLKNIRKAKELLAKTYWRVMFNILHDRTQTVFANYDRETKTLTVTGARW